MPIFHQAAHESAENAYLHGNTAILAFHSHILRFKPRVPLDIDFGT